MTKGFWGASRLVGGSVVVYVAMAACGAVDDVAKLGGHDAATGDGHSSSGDTSGGLDASEWIDAIADAVADAVVNPVADASADPNTSGSRLKAEYLVGADGSKQFLQWWDSGRSEVCDYLV